MAPESNHEKSTISAQSDIWSLGCLVYELVCGKRPYYQCANAYACMFTACSNITPLQLTKDESVKVKFKDPNLKDFLN